MSSGASFRGGIVLKFSTRPAASWERSSSAFSPCRQSLTSAHIGCISKEFRLFSHHYNIDCNGWHVEGDWLGWDYSITDGCGRTVATVSKELFNWTDTYSIEVERPEDALSALMVVLAIDAEKCSAGS